MNQKGSKLTGGAVTEAVLASSKTILAPSKYTGEEGASAVFHT